MKTNKNKIKSIEVIIILAIVFCVWGLLYFFILTFTEERGEVPDISDADKIKILSAFDIELPENVEVVNFTYMINGYVRDFFVLKLEGVDGLDELLELNENIAGKDKVKKFTLLPNTKFRPPPIKFRPPSEQLLPLYCLYSDDYVYITADRHCEYGNRISEVFNELYDDD